jgi:ABC-type antimicrobial peptide transport system permease subunit
MISPFNSDKYRTISLALLLYIAKKNLMSKRLRTGLTLAGVIIGIGAIFFLLSFGLGLQKIVTDEIVGNQSIKSIDVSSPNSQLLFLNTDNLNRFSELPNVEQVGGSYLLPGIVLANGAEIDAVTYGVDIPYQTISNLSAVTGRLLEVQDNRSVVLNQSTLESIGIENSEEAIGQEITLRVPVKTSDSTKVFEDKFVVVGVIATGAGSEVFMPSHILKNEGLESLTTIKLVVRENDDVAVVRSQIEALGFETVSPIDTIEQINQIFRYFNIILVGFGAIGMIVAVLGMFNTLTISLLERTKEIGLMVALGARSRDMKRLFVLEALLLSVIGALIGIISAIIIGFFINIVMNTYARGRGVTESFDLFSTPWWLIIGMVGFMVVIGLVVVYFPARRAEHISPIEALRRE